MNCKLCGTAIDGSSGMCIDCYKSRVRKCPKCRTPSGALRALYRDYHRNNLLIREAQNCDTCNNERWVLDVGGEK